MQAETGCDVLNFAVTVGEIMTLTLEIAPEIEHALEAKAQRAGVPVTDYALRVLHDVAHAPDETDAIPARLAAWNSFVANAPHTRAEAGLGPLGDLSRTAEPDAYGYAEREAEQL
jgi:hypothetical protein